MEKGKFRDSARKYATRRKMWALEMTHDAETTYRHRDHTDRQRYMKDVQKVLQVNMLD